MLDVPSENETATTTYEHAYTYRHQCKQIAAPGYTNRHHLEKHNAPLLVYDDHYPFDVYNNRVRLQVYGSRETEIFGLTGTIDRTANLAMELPDGYNPHVEVRFQIVPCTYDHQNREFLEVNKIHFSLSIVINGQADTYDTGRAYFSGYLEYRDGSPYAIFDGSDSSHLLQ